MSDKLPEEVLKQTPRWAAGISILITVFLSGLVAVLAVSSPMIQDYLNSDAASMKQDLENQKGQIVAMNKSLSIVLEQQSALLLQKDALDKEIAQLRAENARLIAINEELRKSLEKVNSQVDKLLELVNDRGAFQDSVKDIQKQIQEIKKNAGRIYYPVHR